VLHLNSTRNTTVLETKSVIYNTVTATSDIVHIGCVSNERHELYCFNVFIQHPHILSLTYWTWLCCGMLVAPDDGQLAGRNICRALFFKTINVLIGSACVCIVFASDNNKSLHKDGALLHFHRPVSTSPQSSWQLDRTGCEWPHPPPYAPHIRALSIVEGCGVSSSNAYRHPLAGQKCYGELTN
jgi:hypothetical protein